jgi:hypothetical protein
MDGKTYLYRIRNLINESSSSTFLDDLTTYDFLNDAAIEFVQRTKTVVGTQSITTVAEQTNYTLNADFLNLYLRDESHKLYIKYNDGTSNSFPTFIPYTDIYRQISVTSQSVPQSFSIKPVTTLSSQVTGTATSTAAASGGEATLTDTAADFSNVEAGDRIHNTTDDSLGIVLAKTSSTVLVVALFGGKANDWTSSDAYVIQPQGRYELILDPPPSTASHTVTVEYVQRPAPVYADYRVFEFGTQYAGGLISYAAYLYLYRDEESNKGDKLLRAFERDIGRATQQLNDTFEKNRLTVNLKNRQ